MNNTATGGKNIQTVLPVADAKGAYEIRLVSPSAPDHQHHAFSSSSAKRKRTPLPHLGRSYGGRRMRYRWRDQLKPWQVHMLHDADAVATQLGFPLNIFVTANYHGTFAGGAAMATTFRKAMKRMVQWLRDNGVPVAYVFVHENPNDAKPNTHILLHLPASRRLRSIFRQRINGWFDALDGGVKVEARNDAGRLAKGIGTRLQYMAKGADYLTCRRYRGYRAKGGQGPIPFKRAGVSELLLRKPQLLDQAVAA